jgi:intein/homing endonuclease
MSEARTFKLSPSFLEEFENKQPDWGPVGYITYKRCVSIDTPILTRDLRWVKAGEIPVGEEILSFEEYGKTKKNGKEGFRKYVISTITHNVVEEAECVEIELSNGTKLYSTPDHSWLVKKASNILVWCEAQNLLQKRTDKCYMLKYFDVWEEDKSYEGGFLAAAFDGEGCLDRHRSLCFSQVQNEMLDKVKSYLDKFGFQYTQKLKSGNTNTVYKTARKPCYDLRLSGSDQVVRFLGMFRPPRLLAKYMSMVDPMTLKRQKFRNKEDICVVSVKPVGIKKIAVISTSSKTHFTGGFPSHNTYSRLKDDGQGEEFWETCKRVVEGCYNVQKKHCHRLGLFWDNIKAQKSAQEMFTRMWEFKFLPPGRGLWMMGSDHVDKAGGACLNNCAMVSSSSIAVDFAEPFCWAMDMLMLGVGVGFDTKGAGLVKIQEPKQNDDVFVVKDSREGWVSLLYRILDSYTGRGSLPGVIDYSNVRPVGSPIRGFGGTASGPGPLDDLITNVKEVLNSLTGEKITSTVIVDIFNLIGKCVVAGNVRRSAELALGELDDEDFLSLKDPSINQDKLYSHRWACVTGDTLVNLDKGLYSIKELVEQKGLVSSLAGENNDILGVKNTGKKPVFEVNTYGGPCLRATSNHQFLVRNKEGDSWKRLSDLTEGEYLVSSVGPSSFSTDSLSHDYKKGYLLGALIGDGTFVGHNTGKPIARVQVYSKDKGHESLMSFMEDCMNLFPSRSDYKGFSGPHGKGSNGYYFASKKSFTEFAEELGVVKGNKTITKEILNSSKELQAGVISGLFDSDGWFVRDRKTFAIEQSCPLIIERVQQMLLGLDVFCRQRKIREEGIREFPGGAQRKVKAVYRLTISGYWESRKFVSTCGVHHSEKLRSWNSITVPKKRQQKLEHLCYQVSSISFVGEEDVFDACVPAVGAFSGNGLYIHNSNNSIFAKVGMDYSKIANMTSKNGEPGYIWLDNAKAYSRMGRPADDKDRRVVGTNPCGEQNLESMELCNLVETFPSRHESYADFEKTLKYAYLYAKTVTLIPTHSEKTNQIMLRNRRIGTSMSGIIQAMQRHGRREFFNWCENGYSFLKELDKTYSDWLCVRESIKITTVKPSGSVSLLPQVTPGIHFPHSEYYIRRIRFQTNSSLVEKLKNNGYKVEDDKYSPNTVVVEFPVKEEFFDRAKKDVSMWEQLELAAQMQSHWSDNAVSATITFSKTESEDIKHALELYESRLKSVSFLPMNDHGYVQPPYEAITKQEYEAMEAKITPILTNGNIKRDMEDRFCDGEACMIN